MRTFVVESYLATGDVEELEVLAARARTVADGTTIRHLGTFVLLDDEVCFHAFEARSAFALMRASDRVGLPYERIAETLWSGPG